MRAALLAAALMGATVAQAGTIHHLGVPIGEMTQTGFLNPPDQLYLINCVGSECSYRYRSTITWSTETTASANFSLSYTPVEGTTVRSLKLVIYTETWSPEWGYSWGTIAGTATVTDTATGQVIGIGGASNNTGLDVVLSDIRSEGFTITAPLTIYPGWTADGLRRASTQLWGEFEFTQAGPVPEPAEAALWLFGLAALGALARSRWSHHSTHR